MTPPCKDAVQVRLFPQKADVIEVRNFTVGRLTFKPPLFMKAGYGRRIH